MKMPHITGVFLLVLLSCKTSQRSSLGSSPSPIQSQPIESSAREFIGTYEFISPQSVVMSRDSNQTAPKTGQLFIESDGSVTLSVNFYRKARAGSFIEPGLVAAINPTGQIRTENFTVGTDQLLGGSGTQERKIDTFDTQRSDSSTNTIIITSQVTMSTRPYSWFSQYPWKVYKTVNTSMRLFGDTITYSEETFDGISTEIMNLNFKKRANP